MKLTKIALAVAATAMVSTPVLATNGDNLIGLGAQSRALGGTGTAAYFGSENALTNPSLLGKGQGTEFAIGGTLFKPDVKANTNVADPAGGTAYTSQTSDADTNIIPEVSLSTRLNDNWTFGLGIFGSAGMGTDYRDNGGLTEGSPLSGGQDGTGLFNGYSNLQLMKFAPSLAYNNDTWGIGFAPVIQYGALDINYKQFVDTDSDGTPDTLFNRGNGMSSDIGYGFNVGGHFDITPDFTIALAYQSAIDMKYKDQISDASSGFVNSATDFKTPFDDNLEQPAELKIGAAYNMGNFMFTADAKQIKWGSANGYKEFNWKDQNVFGIGAKYTRSNYWVGIGYNRGEDPIEKVDSQTSYKGQVIDMFNNHFFPAVVEQHFTFGGGYNLTKNLALDGAVVYAPEVTKEVNTGLISQRAYNATTHEVTHSQIGYTLSLRMNF
ncbi:MAG: outer membrane protein transport protein [Hydrogenovibrio sp.]|uniref:OmpP1/FadL family transporter n=1 Tax=Hydrogenovibrio sp. TaxID=2065821 RepID=UPI0028707B13|nr:outer membrane protein transport protein [Hydrogenovibrio sp.]MDR9498127.1 outer membrane protein transport protein [Hydrogenovibrio sp.]